jgi:hypothetical protein
MKFYLRHLCCCALLLFATCTDKKNTITQNVCDSVELYTKNKRLIYSNTSNISRNEPKISLFLLTDSDVLPPNEYDEVLNKDEIKKNTVSIIKSLDKFSKIENKSIKDYKRWIEETPDSEFRAIYFLLETGEKYFFVRKYDAAHK